MTTDFGGSLGDSARALVAQADGKLAAAGDVNIGQPSGADFGIARYLAR